MALKDDIASVLKTTNNTISPTRADEIADIFDEDLTSGERDAIRALFATVANQRDSGFGDVVVAARDKIHAMACLAKGECTPDQLQWPRVS